MAKEKNKKTKAKKGKTGVASDPADVAIDDISALTKQVRTLEQTLEAARLERRGAMRKASELGVTHYRIAKAAETSRVVRDPHDPRRRRALAVPHVPAPGRPRSTYCAWPGGVTTKERRWPSSS